MLSDNLKSIRLQKGYTQEQVASELHISRQTLSKWEKGIAVLSTFINAFQNGIRKIALGVILIVASRIMGEKR